MHRDSGKVKARAPGSCSMRVFFFVGALSCVTPTIAADAQPRGSIAVVPDPTGASGPELPVAAPSDATQRPSTPPPNGIDANAPAPNARVANLDINQIRPILECIGADMKASKPELFGLKSPQPVDVFGSSYWLQQGKAPLTTTKWRRVNDIIVNAVSGSAKSTEPFEPLIGLRAEIPKGSTSCFPGQYVLLMCFDCNLLKLYLNGRLVGVCPIVDNGNYEQLKKILDAGVAASATGTPAPGG
jgi:hypothetical protein